MAMKGEAMSDVALVIYRVKFSPSMFEQQELMRVAK